VSRVNLSDLDGDFQFVKLEINGELYITKTPNPTLDSMLQLSDFNFKFSTLSWTQKSESEIIKGRHWIYNPNKPENENSGSCSAAAKKALITLLILLVAFLLGSIVILTYYYKYIYVDREIEEYERS
jgi:hypothetical protein